MNELNPLQEIRSFTRELQTLHSEVQSSMYSGRDYKTIGAKLTEHREKIQDIFQRCINDPALLTELNDYSQVIHTIQTLLPPFEGTSEKVTDVFHLAIFSTKKKLNEAKMINKISLAFSLSGEEIRKQVPKSSEGFFVNAAHLCLDLANKRLHQFIPLGFEEVKAIHDALFDPMIREFSTEGIHSNHFIQPHPAYVFANLHRFLESVEDFRSCEDIQTHVRSYLETKPIPKEGIADLLSQEIPQQKRTLEQIQEMVHAGEEDAMSFLNSFETYQGQLSAFQEGLKDLPIIDVKAILKNSINVNQTFFLNVDGKTHWVFKPSSGNESGAEIVQAECTASQLNYHHQFPIPLTIPLIIKDWEGSAQMYVENAQKITEIEMEGVPINRDQLQKLVIFDLLFANADRNRDNFLFQNLDGSVNIVGIDHDRCLMFKQIEELKIDYLQLKEMREPINEELEYLFSSDAIQTYKTIMIDNQTPRQMLEWINIVRESLNKALEKKTPLKVVVIRLQKLHKTMFLEY